MTSIAGLVLFVLLAVQGVTILRLDKLRTLHFFLGFALLGPLAVKLGSTGYRFARYYAGDTAYGEAGPPRPLLRLAAPVLIVSTLVVFGTGIALAFTSRGRQGQLLFWHKASFIVWVAVTTLHVLAYLWRALIHTADDLRARGSRSTTARRPARLALIGLSLVAGVLAGVYGISRAHHWEASRHGPREKVALADPRIQRP